MLKLAGALMLLGGSAVLGWEAVKRLDARVSALRALMEALELMERELTFRLPPMGVLLQETASRVPEPAAGFLLVCVRELEKMDGQPLALIWRQAALATLSALKKSDLEILMPVGTVLGRYDADGQRCAIAAARTELDRVLSVACEEKRSQGRVYSTLGVTAGALLLILLI